MTFSYIDYVKSEHTKLNDKCIKFSIDPVVGKSNGTSYYSRSRFDALKRNMTDGLVGLVTYYGGLWQGSKSYPHGFVTGFEV